ncbi:MAG: hypothetical protein Q8N81_07540 [bacterium]|nr:hypothetical protein [bacterium]
MTKKFWTQPLILITLFGLLLFGLLSLSVKPTVSDDSPTYIGCAEAIFRLNAGDCSSARTPGYPLLILITDTMFGGTGFIVTVWAQYLLLLASAYLLYKLCLLLFNDKTAGYLAFFLTTTYPLISLLQQQRLDRNTVRLSFDRLCLLFD